MKTVPQVDPLTQLCPQCWREPGRPCKDNNGADREPHPGRVSAALILFKPFEEPARIELPRRPITDLFGLLGDE